jgi:K+-transporting ATPase KdpF subunit
MGNAVYLAGGIIAGLLLIYLTLALLKPEWFS